MPATTLLKTGPGPHRVHGTRKLLDAPSGSTFYSDLSPYLKEGDYVKSAKSRANHLSSLQGTSFNANDFNLDTSSREALWNSLNPMAESGQQDDKTQNAPIIGVVKSVNRYKGVAVINIWKRGDEYLINQRQDQQYTLNKLLKISKAEFTKTCKKHFMRHKQFMLDLKGYGHDDDMPISLIAYHNRIISDLLDRTEDKKHASQGALGHPLSGIRDDLRKVAMDIGGSYLKQSTKKRRDEAASQGQGKEQSATDIFITEQTHVEDEFIPGSPLLTERPFSMKRTQSHQRRPTSKMSRMIAAMSETTNYNLKSEISKRKDKLHMELQHEPLLHQAKEGWRTPSVSPLPGYGYPGSASPTPTPESPTSAPSPTPASPSATGYVVKEVFEHGKLLIAPFHVEYGLPSAAFTAVLEGIVVPHSDTLASIGCRVKDEIRNKLYGQKLIATRYGHDHQGNIRISCQLQTGRSEEDGEEWVQGALVSQGLARVANSLVDQLNLPQEDRKFFNSLETKSVLQLLRLQEMAIKYKTGMWAHPHAVSNFLTTDMTMNGEFHMERLAQMEGMAGASNVSDINSRRSSRSTTGTTNDERLNEFQALSNQLDNKLAPKSLDMRSAHGGNNKSVSTSVNIDAYHTSSDTPTHSMNMNSLFGGNVNSFMEIVQAAKNTKSKASSNVVTPKAGLMLDQAHIEEKTLPALFENQESSQQFRGYLPRSYQSDLHSMLQSPTESDSPQSQFANSKRSSGTSALGPSPTLSRASTVQLSATTTPTQETTPSRRATPWKSGHLQVQV